MEKKKYYITTPIYYINDIPHVGHAYTTIAADILSRYYKAKGEDVFFLTGVDEHGAKIVEAAKKAGLEPKVFADSLVPRFQEAWKNLNIEYSEFFRTTDPKHEEIVKKLILDLKTKGYIEKKKYTGLYCTACEKFLLPDELVDGCCPDHGTKPEEHSEENYFFLLSKVAKEKDLLGVIERGELVVEPLSRKNEVLGKIKQGLEDVSISREKVEWGIPFPGDETQTIYVWIDALINYYSAEFIYFSDRHSREDGNPLKEDPRLRGDDYVVWPPDIHLMAKDILWFHAIIWPAMLLALDLPLPKKVFAHGFFTVGGQKMSKTRGNVLDPNKLVEKFGADAVRYALLREFPFGEDGDISEEKIAARYQSELSNGLGNLVQRTISMMNKYGCHPELDSESRGIPKRVRNDKANKLIEELKFDQALQEIAGEVTKLNQYIEENKPWELAKSNQEKLSEVLGFVLQSLDSLVPCLFPFMPETVQKMKKQLETLEPEPLFPRIEPDK
ncbi:MAG: methionine--tRNA ligase [Patescibacteria group bacterium]|jgi:methionyl-tRNA synthetase